MYPSLFELSDSITITDASIMGPTTLYGLTDSISTSDALSTTIYLLVSEWTINYDNKLKESSIANTMSGVLSTLSNNFKESSIINTMSGVLNDYSNKVRTVVEISIV